MKAKGRLLEFLKYLGMGQNAFEKKVGISNGYIAHSKGSFGADIVAKISSAHPELNINWLLTGEGQMLKTDPAAKPPKVSFGAHIKNVFSNSSDEEIENLFAGEFAKHLLEMYEAGRAYPAVYVNQMMDQIKAELSEARQRIGELTQQVETLQEENAKLRKKEDL